MLTACLFLVGVFLLTVLAVRERARQVSLREKSLDAAPSPLASALAYLVGVAGGIYLGLSLLVDFLAVGIPARVKIAGLEIDPLAAAAVALALLQPFLLRLYRFLRHRFSPEVRF